MLYYSINHQSEPVDFRTAALRGQAPDRGLYFPQEIPVLDEAMLQNLKRLSKEEIAFRMMRPFTGDTIAEAALYDMLVETVGFDFPLVPVSSSTAVLELFHGPTLAFKDVGARFMSRCLGYFSRDAGAETTVLVATSGDTGGAVANGFLGVEGVKVVILYPSGKVSAVQELQLTTCGNNITALEVKGSFDDCQAMVKDAFMDAALSKKRNLTSANSINVARWLPQQLYYAFALQQWQQDIPPVIAVPSGNFGNLCAGLLAAAGGLPVKKFIAACNANDAVVQYLRSGVYQSQAATPTLSNAMDVGNPSNFVRILRLFKEDHKAIAENVIGYSVSDAQTKETISQVYRSHNYVLDPHGAVAWYAMERYLQQQPHDKGVVLETAHPVKFANIVEEVTGANVPVPASAEAFMNKQKQSVVIDATYEALKDFLMG